jgi:SagB-type dehydrogenase family enzyme
MGTEVIALKKWIVPVIIVAALIAGFMLGRPRGETGFIGSIGARFHAETKHDLVSVASSLLRWGDAPGKEKRYDGLEVVKLPEMTAGSMDVEEAIDTRRSVRDYSGEPVTISHLSRLLRSSSGETGEKQANTFRAAPSAGALYPIETYVVVYNVEDIKPGIYHYTPSRHQLELVREGNFRNEFISAALHQDMAGRCNLLYVLTAIFRRTTWKYGERGYRYAYMEAGAISENIYLQAASLGLGTVLIGAFYDDQVSELIGIDGNKEAPILLHAVGSR